MELQKALIVVGADKDEVLADKVGEEIGKIVKKAKKEKWVVLKPEKEKGFEELEKMLDSKNVDEIFACGFIENDLLHKFAGWGLRVVVLKDACREITDKDEKELLAKGITVTTVEKIIE